METHKERIAEQVARLFSAFERSTKPDRAAIYTTALERMPIDKLEAAVSWVIDHWEDKSPPPIAKLRQIAWRGAPGTVAEDEAEQERMKMLLYYLLRYGDADHYLFKSAFGFTPTRETYIKFSEAGQRAFGKDATGAWVFRVPSGVSFAAPDPAWCRESRASAAKDCRAAFHRLDRKHGVELPQPELMARDARDAAAKAANEELPW